MLNDSLLTELDNAQKKLSANKIERPEKIHGACPYGCGRSCSGCEYSCQSTSSKKGGKGGGCFITTATCGAFGKSDDCHELTVLRKFRDDFMQKNEDMKSEVLEYYTIAPNICRNIDKLPNRSEIYENIWKTWINDAVKAVDSKEYQKAHDIYKNMVLSLKNEYLEDL